MIEVPQWICNIIGIVIIIVLSIITYCCFIISSICDKKIEYEEIERKIKKNENKRIQKNNKK